MWEEAKLLILGHKNLAMFNWHHSLATAIMSLSTKTRHRTAPLSSTQGQPKRNRAVTALCHYSAVFTVFNVLGFFLYFGHVLTYYEEKTIFSTGWHNGMVWKQCDTARFLTSASSVDYTFWNIPNEVELRWKDCYLRWTIKTDNMIPSDYPCQVCPDRLPAKKATQILPPIFFGYRFKFSQYLTLIFFLEKYSKAHILYYHYSHCENTTMWFFTYLSIIWYWCVFREPECIF